MKKIISLALIIIILISISSVAFAAGSPTLESRFIPRITASYFRVCDVEGKLVRYLSIDEITLKSVNLNKYNKIENLLYAFYFSSTYELKDGEYVEFPLQFKTENELKAYVNEEENELIIDKIVNDYWMLHISEYGEIIVTVVEK